MDIPPAPEQANQGNQQSTGPNDRSGNAPGPDGSKFNYSFDSTALERAARAARELERSSNAPQALELSRLQEITKQKELEVKQKVSIVN